MKNSMIASKFILLLVLMFLVPSQLFASEGKFLDYSPEKFQDLQEGGEPVVLDFYASWCGTCRKQSKMLSTLLEQDKFSNVTVLKVDYDKAEELREKHRVPRQSTLIMFRGNSEVDRVVASTDEKRLSMLLASGISE